MDSVKCSTCEGSVPSKDAIFFYNRKTKTRNYSCKKHHKCEKCSGELRGPIKTVGNAVFHLKCMECSKCQRTDFLSFTSLHMKNVRYEEKIQKLICGRCNCDICKKPFSYEDKIVPFYSLRIHDGCMGETVCYCGNSLDMTTIDSGVCKFCKEMKCPFCGEEIVEDSDRHVSTSLGRPVYCHGVCVDNMTCGECNSDEILMHCPNLLTLKWTLETEKQQPALIREALKVADVIFKNYRVPKDIVHYIKGKIVDLRGWGPQIPFLKKICVPGICQKRKNPNCPLCDVPLNIMDYETGCTTKKCLKYQFQCTCDLKVPYGLDPLKTCTPYRCYFQGCRLCKGEVLFSASDDSRELCSRENCLIYKRKCRCGDLIRHVPLNGESECSEYRCKLEKCKLCKGQFSYSGHIIPKMYCVRDNCAIYKGECKWCQSSIRRIPQDKSKECSSSRCIKDKCKVCGEVYDFDMDFTRGCVAFTRSSSEGRCKRLREAFYSAVEGFLTLLIKNEIPIAEILKNGTPETWSSLKGSVQIHLETLRKKSKKDYIYAKSILEDVQNIHSSL